MEKVWKKLSDYFNEFDNNYFINSEGEIKLETISKSGIKSEKLLKTSIDSSGKIKVSLKKIDKSTTTRFVDYLMGVIFIKNPNNYIVLNHKDDNLLNNSIDNLEWITAFNNPKYDCIENLEGEIWKDIEGTNIYQVSNKGRIKSIGRDTLLPRTNVAIAKQACLLNPIIESTTGYLTVGLTIDQKIKTKRVHRLVAETFIPNPDNKSQVDHINEIKSDNTVENLQWLNPSENSKKSNSTSITVTFPDKTTKVFNSVNEASDATGYTSGSITAHCSRRSKGNNGYIFRWTDQQSKIGKQNKRKGNNFELDVVNKLNKIGYNTVTARSESKRTDDNKIDIIDLDKNLPINIQTKYTSNTPNYFSIKEQCTDTTLPFGIIWKKSITGKNSPGTVAIIPENFFYELLKLYKDTLV